MKTRSFCLLLAGVLALIAPRPASAALGASVYQPVGLVSLKVPGFSNRALSLPLDPAPAHVGTLSRVRKRSVTWALLSGQDSIVDEQRSPLALRLLSGRGAGLAFPIVRAGEQSATLDTRLDLTELARAGDTFEILAADTLASAFGADGRGLKRSVNPAAADLVQILRDGRWLTFYHDGKAWRLEGDARRRNRNGTVLVPGQGFLFTRRASQALDLQVLGEPPDDNPTPTLRNGGQYLVSSPLATSFRLGDLDLGRLRPGDIAYVLVGRTWKPYTYRGGRWLDERGNGNTQGPLLAPGTAVLLSRDGECLKEG